MPEPQTPQLAFENVSFAFDETPVLRNISFELDSGETLIVLGAAGSGKTVLLKTALGLLRPTEGRVVLFGADVTADSEKEWFDVRSRIGVLFQEGGLFDSLDVAENVAYPLRNQTLRQCPKGAILPKVEESLKFVDLGQTMDKYPSELSGGMRRRVGIARAIVTQPDLLLYDSPTAGLDPITANLIVALITKGRDVRHATTVMVTHRFQDGQILAGFRYDPSTGGLCPARNRGSDPRTRFLVLREGQMVFLGTQEELEASQDPYVSKFIPHA
jgi:phospholipid/cholesterol/gamma-HCH transport system ATP-binding protein